MKEKERSQSSWLIPFLLVVALAGFAVVIILALLGPTIGNIFSNVTKGLGEGGGGGGGSYSGSAPVNNPPAPVYVPPTPAYNPPAQVYLSPTPGYHDTPVPMVQQPVLQPMKAGETDDNADWDTYLQYRQDFIRSYAGLVIDLDVTERQIIKIVNTAGRPVQGARVQVFYGTQLVSETRTYATGMTLFFPNAQPQFSRIDSFRVVVAKWGIVTETSLNTERLDDILTITLR